MEDGEGPGEGGGTTRGGRPRGLTGGGREKQRAGKGHGQGGLAVEGRRERGRKWRSVRTGGQGAMGRNEVCCVASAGLEEEGQRAAETRTLRRRMEEGSGLRVRRRSR